MILAKTRNSQYLMIMSTKPKTTIRWRRAVDRINLDFALAKTNPITAVLVEAFDARGYEYEFIDRSDPTSYGNFRIMISRHHTIEVLHNQEAIYASDLSRLSGQYRMKIALANPDFLQVLHDFLVARSTAPYANPR